MSQSEPVAVWRYRDGVVREERDAVASEAPLEIRVRGRAVSISMRTPGFDAELVAGFLLTEGVIRYREDILEIKPCERDDPNAGNLVNVLLAPLVHVDFESLTRHVFASSSCGVCGKATIESVRKLFSPVASSIVIAAETILALPQRMRDAQATFDLTGGLHAAALFDANGVLVVLREDVGRHNAVDKVLGHALMNGIALDQSILLVSGRTSFEIIQKAVAGRVPIVAAVSAPSSLAVEFAKANGQTLIGFLRESRMNVYSHPERIKGFPRGHADPD